MIQRMCFTPDKVFCSFILHKAHFYYNLYWLLLYIHNIIFSDRSNKTAVGSRKSHGEGILPSQKGIRYYSITYANALNGVFLYNYNSVNNCTVSWHSH